MFILLNTVLLVNSSLWSDHIVWLFLLGLLDFCIVSLTEKLHQI
jgi:hypothetical protein